MGKVYVELSENYQYSSVQRAIFSMLESSEFSKKLFPKAKVLIKTNLLMKKSPEEAVTTHPAVIRAIAEFLIQKDVIPIIGDSPAGPFTKGALEGIYRISGMSEVADKTGALLNYDIGFREVYHPDAVLLKKFDIIDVVLNADFVISAAKMKTHGMMTFTGAVKNLFGVIPGLTKAEYHFKLVEQENFAYHLIDIERFVRPDFSLIDAIDCMEGNGPSNGIKRHVGLLIGGVNPYEVDYTAAEIASIPSDWIPTLKLAEGLDLFHRKNIQRVGYDLKDMYIEPFLLPESLDVTFGLSKMSPWIRNFVLKCLRSSPRFIHSKCISCGHCLRNCPPKIISMNPQNKPIADLKKCISCFCCHEVCPADAIEIRRPFFMNIFSKPKTNK